MINVSFNNEKERQPGNGDKIKASNHQKFAKFLHKFKLCAFHFPFCFQFLSGWCP